MNKNHHDLTQQLSSLSRQTGFTMVELMLAIVLGLLITGAALAIFLGGQRSVNMQNGMSAVQQNAIFGLSQLTHYVRHANLNMTENQKISLLDAASGSSAIGSGIVFSKDNFPASANAQQDGTVTDANGINSVINTTTDRLTIQYQPTYTETVSGSNVSYALNFHDCEGEQKVFTAPAGAKFVLVQRFYIAKMPASQQNTKQDRHALYCDASYYEKNNLATEEGVGSDAQILIPDVDAFKVRLAVKNSQAKTVQYYKLADYLAAGNVVQQQPIVSIELGILARSSENVGNDPAINANAEFDLAGTTVRVTGATNNDPKYLREAFNQVVALRNAQGD